MSTLPPRNEQMSHFGRFPSSYLATSSPSVAPIWDARRVGSELPFLDCPKVDSNPVWLVSAEGNSWVKVFFGAINATGSYGPCFPCSRFTLHVNMEAGSTHVNSEASFQGLAFLPPELCHCLFLLRAKAENT